MYFERRKLKILISDIKGFNYPGTFIKRSKDA